MRRQFCSELLKDSQDYPSTVHRQNDGRRTVGRVCRLLSVYSLNQSHNGRPIWMSKRCRTLRRPTKNWTNAYRTGTMEPLAGVKVKPARSVHYGRAMIFHLTLEMDERLADSWSRTIMSDL